MKAFWSGFPGPCGGANTECYHTAKMLREGGVDLTILPTGGHDNSFREKLEAIGCQVVDAEWGKMADVPGLPGAPVISMCNSFFSNHGDEFREMGCATVWVNCMTFLSSEELRHYRRYNQTYDAYVFQSDWQRKQLEPKLAAFGYKPEQGHRIRGAFALDEWPFQPREAPNERFTIGRLARAAEDKWSTNTWPIYGRARELGGKMNARLMGVDDKIKHKLGKTPDWAEALPQCHESSQEFLASLDVMVSINGGAGENWPRIGLEAMACGVPLVVQDAWGWREMIDHGKTGFLAQNDEQLAVYASLLRHNATLRNDIIHNARAAVEAFADHATIWGQWESMLKGLGA